MEHLNFHSPEWIYTFNKARDDIRNAMAALANIDCDEKQAAVLRGKIIGLKALIERDKERMKNFSINPF